MKKYIITLNEQGNMNMENEGFNLAEILYASKLMEASSMYPQQRKALAELIKEFNVDESEG
jgi:hypothetical protein